MKSLATILSSALLLAVSCTTVPVTGRKSLNLVGDGTINQLGEQTYQQEVSKAKLSTDQNATAMVQRVAQRIAQAAEANFHPNYKWEAKLLDDPKTVNAWCLPGGKIAVYSGILPLTQDETGLAVVLGHETAHALAHHSAERLTRSQLMQLGETGILAAVGAGKPEAVKTVGALLSDWARSSE
jgi:predicted Zn-dependent protease